MHYLRGRIEKIFASETMVFAACDGAALPRRRADPPPAIAYSIKRSLKSVVAAGQGQNDTPSDRPLSQGGREKMPATARFPPSEKILQIQSQYLPPQRSHWAFFWAIRNA